MISLLATAYAADWTSYAAALRALGDAPLTAFADDPPTRPLDWAPAARAIALRGATCESLTDSEAERAQCRQDLPILRERAERALTRGPWFASDVSVAIGDWDPDTLTFPLRPEAASTCVGAIASADVGPCLYVDRPDVRPGEPPRGGWIRRSELFSRAGADVVRSSTANRPLIGRVVFRWTSALDRCAAPPGGPAWCWGATPRLLHVDWPFEVGEQLRSEATDGLLNLIGRAEDVGAAAEGSADSLLNRQLAEMHHRLGALYADRAKAYREHEEEQAYQTCVATPGCDTNDLQVDASVSNDFRGWAMDEWDHVLQMWPSYGETDAVLYSDAFLLLEMGRDAEARPLLQRLVRDHPSSRYAPITWLRLGMVDYSLGNVRQALLSWLKASGDPRFDGWDEGHPAVQAALCYAQLGQLDRAILLLQRVVGRMRSAEGVAVRIEPIVDALGALYADADRVDEGVEWFQQLGTPELARDGVLAVGRALTGQGRYELAAQVYRRALDHAAGDASVPRIWEALVAALDDAGDAAGALAEGERFLAATLPGSVWDQRHADDPATRRDAYLRARSSLGTLASVHHERGRALTRSRRSDALTELAVAERAWTALADAWPDAPDNGVVHYNLGELFYGPLKRPEDALRHYERALELGLADPDHREEAARGAVYAGHDALWRARGKEAIEDAQDAIIRAVERYASWYPDNQEDVAKSVLLVADLLATRQDARKAGEAYLRVIHIAPRSETAVRALEGIMAMLSDQRDWEGAEAIAAGVLADAHQPGLRARARTYLEQARYMTREEACNKASDPATCATIWEGYLAAWPTGDERERALWHFSTSAYAAGRLGDAIGAREELLRTAPGGRAGEESLQLLGGLYEEAGRYDEAVAAWIRFAEARPTAPAASDALRASIDLLLSLERPEPAIRPLELLLARRPPDAYELHLRVASIEARLGRPDRARARLATFWDRRSTATPEQQVLARREFARLAELDGHPDPRLWDATLRAWRAGPRTDRTDLAAAETLVLQAEALATRTRALRIDGPPPGVVLGRRQLDDLLRRQLAEKVAATVRLEEAWAAVYAVGIPQTGLRALLGEGAASEDLADTIALAYVPPYLTDDQRELYQYGLQDRAWAGRERARQHYLAAVHQAAEAGYLGPEVRAAQARLAVLAPDDHPPTWERLPAPRMSDPGDGFETEP